MRAPQTEAAGTSGQSFAKAEFEQLGWGAVLNVEHDLGTDLWLMARDLNRFDLGVLIGAQVKSGQSYFESPERDEASTELAGWWYAESDNRHFEYWSGHSIPHLLILRNPNTKLSYWVHVTSDVVKSTGKGSKILVPVNQTISEKMRDALTAVATSPAKSAGLDGSAWNVGKPVPGSDRLRYALVAPRLVAPHANLGGVIPTASEAIAMLMQGRFHDLQEVETQEVRAEHKGVHDADAWEWELFDALGLWVLKGDPSKLEGLRNGDEVQQRAAVAAVRATAYSEFARPQDGLDAVQACDGIDALGTIDGAWLWSHEARCLLELGRLEEARERALKVQRLRAIAPQDPTAVALVASSTALIFNAANLGSRDIGELIQSIDTSTRWWRASTIASGLQKQFEDSYKTWGRDSSVTWFASDQVWTSLRSAALLAGVSADHSGWSNATSLLARRELMKAEPDQEHIITESLRDLLRSGSKKELVFAAKRFGDDGPVGPLIALSSELDLPTTPRSCLSAALAFLRHAGDFALTSDADCHASWLIASLEDPVSLRKRLKPMFLVESALLEALQGLMRSVSSEMMRRIIDHLLDLPVMENQHLANSYRRIFSRVDERLWKSEDLVRLASRAGDNWELQEDIDAILATHNLEFRASLLERIKEGHLASLSNFGDVRDLPEDAAEALIQVLVEGIGSQLDEARKGSFSFGGHDLGHIFVILNAWHPGIAKWSAVMALLSEPRAHPSHIYGAINTIGRLEKQIGESEKAELKPILYDVAQRSSLFSEEELWSKGEDPQSAAKLALARLYPEDVTDSVLRNLLRGSNEDRRALASLLGDRKNRGDMSILFALSQDEDPDIRVNAIVSLARWVSQDGADEEVLDEVTRLVQLAGPRVAKLLSSYLEGRPPGDVRAALLDILKDHPSGLVRTRVSRAVTNT